MDFGLSKAICYIHVDQSFLCFCFAISLKSFKIYSRRERCNRRRSTSTGRALETLELPQSFAQVARVDLGWGPELVRRSQRPVTPKGSWIEPAT